MERYSLVSEKRCAMSAGVIFLLRFKIAIAYSCGCPLLSQEEGLREAQTGWFRSNHFSKCIPAMFRQGNHPVRAFGAATPPDSGGDTRTNTRSQLRKGALRRPLPLHRQFQRKSCTR